MNIENIFKNNRRKEIEELEFFFFINEVYFDMMKKNSKNKNKNSRIEEFIDMIGKYYYFSFYINKNYLIMLEDYVYWQSSEIYLENIKQFVSNQSNAADFASTIYFLIQNDKKKCESLAKDFEKQSKLELNIEIFKFSKTINDFEFILEKFIPEKTTNLTENELREIFKKILPKIENYYK